MKSEQRRATRKTLDSSGILTMSGIPFNVKTIDVGAGGLSVGCAKQLTVGKDCHLNFGVPAGDEIRNVAASAHVVYCFFKGSDGYKIGLQFLKVHADGANVIAEYIGE
jgi:hypothetical protein